MAKFSLVKSSRVSKQKIPIPPIPQELEGVNNILESLGLKDKFTAMGMDFTMVLLGIGQKLLKSTSEISFLANCGLISMQRRFNRFLHKTQGEIVFSTLLKSLPAKIFCDPCGVLILDDSPLPKSGKKMHGAKKLYHNGFFHGYELLTLAYSCASGVFPVAFSLKTKFSASKLTLGAEILNKVLEILPVPRWVVFDSWYTVKPLLEPLIAMKLLFIGAVKNNYKFIYRGRVYHARDFIRLASKARYACFDVSCAWCSRLRLIVFRRKLSSGKFRYEILLTNDFTTSARKIAMAYLRRWNIETTFRTFKQSFALNEFHNRNLTAIVNHIAFSFCALLLVAYLKSLFHSLRLKSHAWIRTFVFFARKLCRILLPSGLSIETKLICPNYRYFKRFGVLRLGV